MDSCLALIFDNAMEEPRVGEPRCVKALHRKPTDTPQSLGAEG
jgi:hypothetical protein